MARTPGCAAELERAQRSDYVRLHCAFPVDWTHVRFSKYGYKVTSVRHGLASTLML